MLKPVLRSHGRHSLFAAGMLGILAWMGSASATETTFFALSLVGEPQYTTEDTHLSYVNPEAPKGGTYRQAVRGTFDNLNPFALKGSTAFGLGLTLQTLMSGHEGEPLVQYPSVSERVTVADDLSYVRFDIDPRATFSDGSPITVDDIIFSFEILTSETSLPTYRKYYADVERAEQTGPRQVTFFFRGPPNRELPQIVGQLPVLSQAYWQDRDFSATTLEPPISSGPYRIKDFEAGRFIEYERVTDWWAANTLINTGRYNFDVIRYDYYLDDNALRLAFQKGEADFRQENTALHWATSYAFPAVQDGRVIKTEIADESPQGMQAFVINTRRPQFQDRRVRQALNLAFDFEWTNRERFFDAYSRTTSYYQGSEFEATGLPSLEELALLDAVKNEVPTELFTRSHRLPVTDGSGRNRAELREAKRLLTEAGWTVDDAGVLRNAAGEALALKVMLISPAFERIVDPFLQNLQRLGIQTRMQVRQQAEYVARLREFDFDLVVTTWRQSNSPGNEQRFKWGSAAATEPSSENYAGIQNVAVDHLIDALVGAPDRDTLIQATRALDRTLLWGAYSIPQWHVPTFRIAYWDKFGRPDQAPGYGIGLFTWWIDADKVAALEAQGTE